MWCIVQWEKRRSLALDMSIKPLAVQAALNECRFDHTESTGAFWGGLVVILVNLVPSRLPSWSGTIRTVVTMSLIRWGVSILHTELYVLENYISSQLQNDRPYVWHILARFDFESDCLHISDVTCFETAMCRHVCSSECAFCQMPMQ